LALAWSLLMSAGMARRQKRGGKLNNPHDKVFKAVFGRPENAADLIRALLPQLQSLGMSALTPMPTNSVDAQLREHFSDLCYSAKLHDDNSQLCLLLEHKSTVERLTALAISRHVIDIAGNHARARPTHRLPLIIPIVVYHGIKPWNAPRALHELYGGSRRTRTALRKELLRGSFVLYDVARDSDDALRARGMNPLATLTLWLLAHARTEQLMTRLHQVRDLCEAVLGLRGGVEDFIMLMHYSLEVSDLTFEELDEYMRGILSPRAKETYMTVAEQLRREGRQQGLKRGRQQGLKRGREQGLQRGLEQGLEQGLESGRRSLLLTQLEHRFGTVPAEMLEQIDAATSEQLDSWALRLLSASSLDDVFTPSTQ
jgi:predicted transposase YdaD